TDVGVGGAGGELLEAAGNDACRPRVASRDGGLTSVHATQLFAVGAVLGVLVHVVSRQRRGEAVRLRPIRRSAAIPLTRLGGLGPVPPVAHNLRTRMIRTRRRR